MIGKNKKQNGFSFIEAIISVFLLSVGMVAILNLISSGLRETLATKDQQIATLLAQEGVELVRNVRDNNWASEVETFAGFPANDVYDRKINYNYNPSSVFTSGGSYTLNLSSNFYTHSGGTATKFKRKLFVDYDVTPNPNTAEITSIVWWGTDPGVNNAGQLSNCTTAKKCTYVKTTLSKWADD